MWALKIKSIEVDQTFDDDDIFAIITPENKGYAPFQVDEKYLNEHRPQVGGYYIVYKDGYKSFSLSEPFEEANVLIENDTILGRLIIEEEELGQKIVAINNYLDNGNLRIELGTTQYELLALQHSIMLAYRRTLNMRISDLKKVKP